MCSVTNVSRLGRWKELLSRGAGNGTLRSDTGANVVALALLAAALVYAAVDHGAFFATGFRIVVLLALGAAIVSFVRQPLTRREISGPLVAVGALAVWYIVAALIAGDASGAQAAVEMLAALAAVLVVVPRASVPARTWLLHGLLLAGLVVAVSGWLGFVAQHQPLAIPDTCCGGIWRAASTVTYANGAAAFLAPCVLIAFALTARSTKQRAGRLVDFALLVGFLATFSRGGVIALLVGAVVLTAIDGWGPIRRSAPAIVGALLATAALLPSLRLTEHRHVALAIVGLIAGAVASALPSTRAVVIVVAVFAIGGLAVSGVRGPVLDGWRTVAHGRITTSSPDRSRAVDAALHLAREHPVAGVGPGRVDLSWRSSDPSDPGRVHLRYAHDEYVQVLAETGGVGFAILAAGLATTAITVWRRRRSLDSVAAAGCIAGLAALAVHSATDYLWHIALLPLAGAVLVAVVLPRPPPP